MKTIKAISATDEVVQWLAYSKQPRVLHVFENACNLINEFGNVLSIVKTPIGNGPFNLVIGDDKIDFRKNIEGRSLVSIDNNSINAGTLVIQFAYAQEWNPRPQWDELRKNKNEVSNRLKLLEIDIQNDDIQNETILHFSNSLSSAIIKVDILTIKNISSKFAGLGQGLTPSGDDYIMGAMHATWIIHPTEKAMKITKEMADTAGALTTSLSRAWLNSAGKGHAGILWHQFFDALVSGDHMRDISARDKILAVGETSGADALAGFISVFNAWHEFKGKELTHHENPSN